MKKTKKLTVSQLQQEMISLRVFDRVLLSGIVYTARDVAHKKMLELLTEHRSLPFFLKGSILYYAGPTNAPDHLSIGSCGPTTSARMDRYTPHLLSLGLCATIGKGERSATVVKAIQQYQSAYFCAIGGAGALACQCITSCEVIAFPELGCESIKKLTFKDFPLVVGIDSTGADIFKQGQAQYRNYYDSKE